jgi:phage-related minor tail protein
MTHAFIDWDAKHWELYDKPGAEVAAQKLTQAFNNGTRSAFLAMAEGVPPRKALQQLEQAMFKEMQLFDDFGASDTDVRHRLNSAFLLTFGEDLWTVEPSNRLKRSVQPA